MKFSISSRQPAGYLARADEIIIAARDIRQTYDIFEKYPNTEIVLELFGSVDEIDWNQIKEFNTLGQGKFTICIANLNCVEMCKELEIPFFYGYEANSFIMLDSLKKLGVSQVRITDPIFFQMDKVKSFGVPVRVIGNLAYDAYIPRETGVNGSWIRPEDLETYAEYVDTVEFAFDNLPQEQALFRIYAEQKHWPGPINMIIKNFNHIALNRLILPDVAQARLNCGQRCVERGTCHICFRSCDLADAELLQEYRDSEKKSLESFMET